MIQQGLANRAHYFSTACLHDTHDECRRRCKFCEAPCQCACHGAEQASSEREMALAGTGGDTNTGGSR